SDIRKGKNNAHAHTHTYCTHQTHAPVHTPAQIPLACKHTHTLPVLGIDLVLIHQTDQYHTHTNTQTHTHTHTHRLTHKQTHKQTHTDTHTHTHTHTQISVKPRTTTAHTVMEREREGL